MPFLSIQTNVALPQTTEKTLLAELSKMLAAQLGKPEQYMMASIAPRQTMSFGGSDAPAAFLALNSIGLPESKLNGIAASISALLKERAGIPSDRVYIVFQAVDAKHWAHDRATFG